VAVGADHLVAVVALSAVRLAATPRRIDEHTTEFGVLADDFVTEHHREGPTEVSVGDVNVRVTHATGDDFDDLLTGSGDGDVPFLNLKRLSDVDENERFHGTSTMRLLRVVAGDCRLGYSRYIVYPLAGYVTQR
jgi:hypothetical protein